jgi:alpha-beta hydrolase superfamily lysophospholipase
MKTRDYWKKYLCETDAAEIERNLKQATFKSRYLNLSLKYFESGKDAPNILWVVGTGCYSMYLAELGYHMHLRGFNTFGIDFQGHGDSEGKRGDFNLNELTRNCFDAAIYIVENYNRRIGAVGVSMGGFITFYLSLSHSHVKSIACLNPGIVSEKAFKDEVTRLRKVPPMAGAIARLFPKIMIPTERCVDFMGLARTEREKRHVEIYLNDPNIVKRYALRAVMSLISTPPPKPVEELNIPTMFLAPRKDALMSVIYVRNLYDGLPPIKKKLVEIDGSHFWMSSHPREASKLICDWFNETLT